MEYVLLHRIGQELRNSVNVAVQRVRGGHNPHRPVKVSSDECVAGWIAGDVEGRSRVGVGCEWRSDTLLGGQQAGEVRVDLADLAVGTWNRALRRSWAGREGRLRSGRSRRR